MTEDELVAAFPRLWHMAHAGAWPAVRERGLRSTAVLLDDYGIIGETRAKLEQRRRPDAVALRRDGLPDAVIRDQKPLSDERLARCLDDGLTPDDWHAILNAHVFFWPSRARVRRLLGARAYRHLPQTVLTVRTASLVAAHRDRIRLSPINSGSTLFVPQRRGRGTFQRIEDYPFADLARRRSVADAVVEVLVEGAVSDIAGHTLAVHDVRHGEPANLIWRSPDAGDDDRP